VGFHAVFASAFVALSTAGLVWPQWVALEGSRTALAISATRERDTNERLTQLRLLNERLRAWERSGRRVLLAPELTDLPAQIREIARRSGAAAPVVEVTEQTYSRWRTVSVQGPELDDVSVPAGEIRPRTVRLVLHGTFDAIFRTVATLGQQQWLFVPDRWDINRAAEGGSGAPPLRAEIWASVFQVLEPAPNTVTEPGARSLARADAAFPQAPPRGEEGTP
jgi:hypothetical protein